MHVTSKAQSADLRAGPFAGCWQLAVARVGLSNNFFHTATRIHPALMARLLSRGLQDRK